MFLSPSFTESSDEGISMGGSASDSSEDLQTTEDLQREMLELRQQLNHERLLRVMLEDRTRSLEAQLYHPQHHSHVPTLVHTQMNLKVVSKEQRSPPPGFELGPRFSFVYDGRWVG